MGSLGDRALTLLILFALGYLIYHKLKYGKLPEFNLKDIDFRGMFGGGKK